MPNRFGIESESDIYEKHLEWQQRIALGLPKPEGLSEGDAADYDRMARELDAAARLGYKVDVPRD